MPGFSIKIDLMFHTVAKQRVVLFSSCSPLHDLLGEQRPSARGLELGQLQEVDSTSLHAQTQQVTAALHQENSHMGRTVAQRNSV